MATRKAETQVTEQDTHNDKRLKVNEQVSTEEPEVPVAPKTKQGKSKTEESNKAEKEHTTIPTETVTTAIHIGHPHAKAAELKTIERGHLFFFYRPKIELDDASSFDEVQKFYIVLRPESGGDVNRLIVLTKKRLPKVSSHERIWGYMEKTSHNMDVITHELDSSTYETKTRGTRHQAGAKPCGCGVYNIIHRSGGHKHQEHTRFTYVLELPEMPGDLQNSFNIQKEGSYILIIKNPNKTNPPQVHLPVLEKAEYPSKLQVEFHNKRWAPADDNKLLDFDRAEILLIGVAKDEDVHAQLIECAEDLEKEAQEEEKEEHEHPGCLLDPSLFAELAKKKAPNHIIPTAWPAHTHPPSS